MSNEKILTDKELREIGPSTHQDPAEAVDALHTSHVAANAEIARLREEVANLREAYAEGTRIGSEQVARTDAAEGRVEVLETELQAVDAALDEVTKCQAPTRAQRIRDTLYHNRQVCDAAISDHRKAEESSRAQVTLWMGHANAEGEKARRYRYALEEAARRCERHGTETRWCGYDFANEIIRDELRKAEEGCPYCHKPIEGEGAAEVDSPAHASSPEYFHDWEEDEEEAEGEGASTPAAGGGHSPTEGAPSGFPADIEDASDEWTAGFKAGTSVLEDLRDSVLRDGRIQWDVIADALNRAAEEDFLTGADVAGQIAQALLPAQPPAPKGAGDAPAREDGAEDGNPRSLGSPAPCTWTEDGDDWVTKCGWHLPSETQDETGVRDWWRFCPYCGGRLEVVPPCSICNEDEEDTADKAQAEGDSPNISPSDDCEIGRIALPGETTARAYKEDDHGFYVRFYDDITGDWKDTMYGSEAWSVWEALKSKQRAEMSSSPLIDSANRAIESWMRRANEHEARADEIKSVAVEALGEIEYHVNEDRERGEMEILIADAASQALAKINEM